MRLRALATVLLLAAPCFAARLHQPTQRAFDDYAAQVETRLARQHATSKTYLAALNVGPAERADIERQLRAGAVRIEPVNGGTREVSGGLLHHWRGTAFVPGANAEDMLALLRDYTHLPAYYAPEVVSSRPLADRGEFATLALRLRKQKVVTAVLDAEYQVQSGLADDHRGFEISRSAHIWQVESPGTAHEHHLREGDDDGYLWRLNTYWSFLQQPDGLLIECEAISLTRDVPAGLGWLVLPIIQELPRESLEFTLRSTRNALENNVMKEAHR
jgi:hypothetical protein